MHLVTSSLPDPGAAQPEVAIRADRHMMAKRIWRAQADDGTEFGFQLDTPLRDGACVYCDSRSRYILRQDPEPVLEIPWGETAESAAITGWAIGNYHFPIEVQPGRILAPDDPALRQWLARVGLSFHAARAVFRPHRVAETAAPHSH